MLTKRLLISTLFLATTAACSDDGGDDEACVGHDCDMGGVKYTDPEGGNILFEYIYFDTELATAFQLPPGVTTATRIIGYFLNAHEPNANPLPAPGVCTNLVATKGWPMHVGATREELDVGTVTVVGKNTAGMDVTIDVPKKPMGTDSIGRPHNTYYQTILPGASNYQKFDSSYTVKFGGAGNIPATEFKDALFLSADFSVTMPNLEGNGPLRASADFTVNWNPAQSMNAPMGTEILGVTWLADSNGSPTHICPVGNDAGTFTIPKATIAEYRQIAMARGTNPDKVVLLRNAIVHRLARLPNNDRENLRRIDMVTVNCWAQLMDCTAQ